MTLVTKYSEYQFVIPGASEASEPGIHNHRPGLWIPGSRPSAAPRNDGAELISLIPYYSSIVTVSKSAGSTISSTSQSSE